MTASRCEGVGQEVWGSPYDGCCRRHCPRGRLRLGMGRCRKPPYAKPQAGRSVLPARAVLRDPVRVLRLQHLHGGRARGRRRRQASYAEPLSPRSGLARRVLGGLDRPVETVFFGGGTPTLLPAKDLGRMLAAVRDEFGLAAGAEVTTEANPESVDPAYLDGSARGRVHPAVVRDAVRLAARAEDPGPQHTPGPALAGGQGGEGGRVRACEPGPDLRDAGGVARGLAHVVGVGAGRRSRTMCSAYALIVEDGTQLARQVRRGELPMPDDDDAGRPVPAGRRAADARPGLGWYEVSNWARPRPPAAGTTSSTGAATTWWGIGPGAHSHVGGVRWWNVKHPSAYADRLAAGEQSGPRPRGPGPRDPPDGACPSRVPARGRLPWTSWTKPAARRSTRSSTTVWLERGGRLVLTRPRPFPRRRRRPRPASLNLPSQ